MLRNEKSDSVTRSVVTSSKPFPSASPTLIAGPASTSRGFSNRTSRGTFPPLFSNVYSLLDGLRPSLPAVSLRRTSQMLCALPSASPTLLAGFACTSRGFSNRTSRRFHRHFSNVYSLIGGSVATFSPLPPSWNIAAFNSDSDKVPSAESAKSFSTLGSSDSFSTERCPR